MSSYTQKENTKLWLAAAAVVTPAVVAGTSVTATILTLGKPLLTREWTKNTFAMNLIYQIGLCSITAVLTHAVTVSVKDYLEQKADEFGLFD